MNKPELRKRLHDLEQRLHELFDMDEDDLDIEFVKIFPAVASQAETCYPLRSLAMFAVEQAFPISVRS